MLGSGPSGFSSSADAGRRRVLGTRKGQPCSRGRGLPSTGRALSPTAAAMKSSVSRRWKQTEKLSAARKEAGSADVPAPAASPYHADGETPQRPSSPAQSPGFQHRVVLHKHTEHTRTHAHTPKLITGWQGAALCSLLPQTTVADTGLEAPGGCRTGTLHPVCSSGHLPLHLQHFIAYPCACSCPPQTLSTTSTVLKMLHMPIETRPIPNNCS